LVLRGDNFSKEEENLKKNEYLDKGNPGVKVNADFFMDLRLSDKMKEILWGWFGEYIGVFIDIFKELGEKEIFKLNLIF
jgi:hypothetical protein